MVSSELVTKPEAIAKAILHLDDTWGLDSLLSSETNFRWLSQIYRSISAQKL